MTDADLTITRLGQRGEGVADGPNGLVYVPYALPGEIVRADVDGDLGHLIEFRTTRSDRVLPICPYFEACGGCAVQALPDLPYAEWKRGLVSDVLGKAGIVAEVQPLIDAHGDGRRRATFHARVQSTPNLLAERKLRVGFMRARSHELIDIAACPILSPKMTGAVAAARALAKVLAPLGKPLDIVMTASQAGLDVDLRGVGPVPTSQREALARVAVELDLARVSLHGEIVLERQAPFLPIGKSQVVLPPGAFLQATEKGEQILADLVEEGVGSAKKVADLFCGLGTFALRLAARATVHAVDLEGQSLAALARAAGRTPGLRPLKTEARDLFRRPLLPEETTRFDAVVFDPPRAGAQAQAQALAGSTVPTIVAVSCNPATFARDAGLLISGGYKLVRVTPVDQFKYSPHVELVGVFRREKSRRPRPLLG